jgi:hypothetical protein
MSRTAKRHQANTSQTECRHHFNVDNHNVGTCSLCGEVRQFPLEKGGEVVVLKAGRPPAKPGRPKRNRTWTDIHERKRYYESHRDEIVRDLLTLGRPATLKKWGIPTSTITGLEKRWLKPEYRAAITRASGAAVPLAHDPGTPGDGHLPHFPEFSNTWDPTVQLTWLEVYRDLHARPQTATP